jgi:hypothetical protein
MAKPLDPAVTKILTEYGEDPKDTRNVVWDCHGTWVVYHKALERVAARAKIRFDLPITLEANGSAKSVAVCVTGYMGDRTEWSIGEASPANCKNAYPYAIAEKRGKDRVILKLLGLHGLAYSEDEADDFTPRPLLTYAALEEMMTSRTADDDLVAVTEHYGTDIKALSKDEQLNLRKVFSFKREALKLGSAA